MRNGKRQSAFTMIEALVCLAIIGVLAALALAAIQRSRSAALRAGCAAKMRQLALAVMTYEAHEQHLPVGCGYPFLNNPGDVTWQSGMSWQTSILPYIEQQDLWYAAWSAQQQDPSAYSDANLAVADTVVPLFLCPADGRSTGSYGSGPSWALTSYVGVAGTGVDSDNGMFHPNLNVRFADVTHGTSNTLLIGERPAGPDGVFGGWYAAWGFSSLCRSAQILPASSYPPWIPPPPYASGCNTVTFAPLQPGNLANGCDVNHFWSLHPGGANFAFVDGSVHFIPYKAAAVLPALAARNGSEPVALDF
jgi:prepilin-type N-terminal cleavage/methylation domain-containing protein/prepilin-type processing-associated H-X9-DG protein